MKTIIAILVLFLGLNSFAFSQKVQSSVNQKPDASRIQKDLQGHELTEGFERSKCYFSEETRWKLTTSAISYFKIDKVLENNSKHYTVVVSMRYKKKYTSFYIRARVAYLYQSGWKIEYVKSLGVSIIPSKRYNDCISCLVNDDGWGGTYALFITNSIDIDLVVGGTLFFTDGKSRNFSTVVSPHDTEQVGGLFAGGSVKSYKISFVERPDR